MKNNYKLIISALFKHAIQMDEQKFTPEEKEFIEDLNLLDQVCNEGDRTNMSFFYGGFELFIKVDRTAKEWTLVYTKGDTDADGDGQSVTVKFGIGHRTVVDYWMYEPDVLELMVVAFKPIVEHFFTNVGFPELQRSLFYSGEL